MPAIRGAAGGDGLHRLTGTIVALSAHGLSGMVGTRDLHESTHRDGNGLQSRDTGLSNYGSVNAAAILAMQQKRTIQIMCACMACISILAAMCAIYWFTMMRRNYRRDLVFMLILGDFYKSLWYLIYGSVSFGRGQVKSSDPFCQVSGFMLQSGLEACGRSTCKSRVESFC